MFGAVYPFVSWIILCVLGQTCLESQGLRFSMIWSLLFISLHSALSLSLHPISFFCLYVFFRLAFSWMLSAYLTCRCGSSLSVLLSSYWSSSSVRHLAHPFLPFSVVYHQISSALSDLTVPPTRLSPSWCCAVTSVFDCAAVELETRFFLVFFRTNNIFFFQLFRFPSGDYRCTFWIRSLRHSIIGSKH